MAKIEKMETLDIMAIPLTQGLYALVDGENYEELSKYKWFAVKDRSTFYAVRNISKFPNQRTIRMHRQILNVLKGRQTDHINHCGLDNREVNLRSCTISQNHQNSTIRKGTSCYRGVSWNKNRKKWQATIKHHGRSFGLGYFNAEIQAAKAYDRKAIELFGEFACCNFLLGK